MKIRSQLIVAFLLLAVLPLTSLVLYSYYSSLQALERAVESEAGELTAAMEKRLEDTTEKLDRRIERLRALPFAGMLGTRGGPLPDRRLLGRLMSEIGDDMAPFFESIMIIPRPPGAPPQPPGAPPHRRAGVPRARPTAPAVPAERTGVLEEAEVSPREAPAMADPEFGPFRIDLTMLREEYDEETLEEAVEETWIVEDHEAVVTEEDVVVDEEEIARLTAQEAAEIGEQTAEIVRLGLEQAMDAIRESLDQAPSDEERRQLRAEERRLRTEERRLRLEEQARALAKKAERHHAIVRMEIEEHRRFLAEQREMNRFLGREVGVEIRDAGELVGEIRPAIRSDVLMREVLKSTPRDHGEIPFALDAEGRLYPAEDADLPRLEEIGLERDPDSGEVRARHGGDEWMVVSLPYPERGLVFGVARPMGDALADLGATAMRNLLIGLALIALALFGILPLSKRITGGLEAVTEGAQSIARGDLRTRVPVTSKNEVGQLALAFNQMAEDLETHQNRLVEEEARRREEEIEKHYLQAEFERKSRELEDAREFQLSLLPHELPRHQELEIAVDMKTATEVGGDYYDYHHADDGVLTFAIGDATGHGARAGTMVTVVKSLFSSSAAEHTPGTFLQQAASTVRRMELGRMAMALTLARFAGGRLTISAAGMPPALIHRAASDAVEEIALAGMPLGGLETRYREKDLELAVGDTLLLFSDGFPELPNPNGEPFGYDQTRDAFRQAAAARSPAEIIAELDTAAAAWAETDTPSDDMTFLVVRRKAA